MFMFQNGLLATFIPEIIMVLAYAFCFLGPAKTIENNHSNNTEQSVTEAHSTTNSSVYSFEQHFIQSAEIIEQNALVYTLADSQTITEYKFYRLTDYLSFVQFSRPPPSFLV